MKNARKESFDFRLHPRTATLSEGWPLVLGASPSKTRRSAIKTRIGDLLEPRNKGASPRVRNRLNRLLVVWSAYFGYGARLQAYRAVDHHVYDRVRRFLVQRHKVQGRGTRRFSREKIYGELGVFRLKRPHLAPPPVSLTTKPVGKPDAGNPHVRFDERGRETGRWPRLTPPRPSSTLHSPA